jgi:hypothetical protein
LHNGDNKYAISVVKRNGPQDQELKRLAWAIAAPHYTFRDPSISPTILETTFNEPVRPPVYHTTSIPVLEQPFPWKPLRLST